jgi:hypothetical protein
VGMLKTTMMMRIGGSCGKDDDEDCGGSCGKDDPDDVALRFDDDDNEDDVVPSYLILL